MLKRLTDGGSDGGIYLQDGLLHFLESRVISGGASLQTVYLPVSIDGAVTYTQCELRNGILYAAGDGPDGGETGESSETGETGQARE